MTQSLSSHNVNLHSTFWRYIVSVICFNRRLQDIFVNIFHITVSMQIYSLEYEIQANIFHYHQYSIFLLIWKIKQGTKVHSVWHFLQARFLVFLLSVNCFSAVVNCLHGTLVCLVSCTSSRKGRHIEFPTFIALMAKSINPVLSSTLSECCF